MSKNRVVFALAVAAALVVLAATLWHANSGGQPAPGAAA